MKNQTRNGFPVSSFQFRSSTLLALLVHPTVNLFYCGAAVTMLAGMTTGAWAASRTTATNGNWSAVGTWDGGAQIPQDGDDVTIGHTVTQDVSSAALASVTINAGKTLTFTGWTTALTATVVTVNGTITHLAQPDTSGTVNDPSTWDRDHRVWIVCSNLTVASAPAKIDVNGMGYKATSGAGLGGGAGQDCSGASYGGLGGTAQNGASPNATYGSASAPEHPGSGGRTGNQGTGGPGGGMVTIEATGAVTVNGTIVADGVAGNNSYSSSGSGGGIYITCRTFEGSGSLSAKGGSHAAGKSGSGGGGRIAIVFDSGEQQTWAGAVPTFTVASGTHGTAARTGSGGSLHVSDPNVIALPEENVWGIELSWPDSVVWTPNSLSFSNGFSTIVSNLTVEVDGGVSLRGTVNTPQLTLQQHATLVCADLLLTDATLLTPSKHSTVHCANLLLTNSADLTVYPGVTNASWPTYTVRVIVDGDMDVHSGSAVTVSAANYATHSPPDGGLARFDLKNLTIHNGGSFNANALGYSGGRSAGENGFGPGGGVAGGTAYGGGYGGKGGGSNGGRAYGATNAPYAYGATNAPPGSGGGYKSSGSPSAGGDGGGCIWIRATGDVTVNGTISANGESVGGAGAAAGSGGGVFIACRAIQGTTNITANGGNATHGTAGYGGGGGRVAVWYGTLLATMDAYLDGGPGAPSTNAPAGYGYERLSAAKGTSTSSGNDGAAGTTFFYTIPPPAGTVFLFR